MLSPQERSQIKLIIQSPYWETVQRAAQLYCAKLMDDSFIKDSQWETVKATLSATYQKQGIVGFLNELYKEAQHE